MRYRTKSKPRRIIGRPRTGGSSRKDRGSDTGGKPQIKGIPDAGAAAKPTEPAKYFTPTIRIPQPDGSLLVKAGKPIPLEDYISVKEIARICGMSRRWAQTQCDMGRFKTAWKPGGHSNSQWRAARSEIMALREGWAP